MDNLVQKTTPLGSSLPPLPVDDSLALSHTQTMSDAGQVPPLTDLPPLPPLPEENKIDVATAPITSTTVDSLENADIPLTTVVEKPAEMEILTNAKDDHDNLSPVNQNTIQDLPPLPTEDVSGDEENIGEQLDINNQQVEVGSGPSHNKNSIVGIVAVAVLTIGVGASSYFVANRMNTNQAVAPTVGEKVAAANCDGKYGSTCTGSSAPSYAKADNAKVGNDGKGFVSGTYIAPNGTRHVVAVASTIQAANNANNSSNATTTYDSKSNNLVVSNIFVDNKDRSAVGDKDTWLYMSAVPPAAVSAAGDGGGGGGGGNTPTSVPVPTNTPMYSCNVVKAYHLIDNSWVIATNASTIKQGAAVRFAVKATGGTWKSASFRVTNNNSIMRDWINTTDKNSGGEFYLEMTLPNSGTYQVEAGLIP